MDNNIPIVHILNFLTVNQKNTVGILAYDTVCEVIGTVYTIQYCRHECCIAGSFLGRLRFRALASDPHQGVNGTFRFVCKLNYIKTQYKPW